MLPSQGRCHTVFLLNHVIGIRPRVGLDDWIQAAREKPAFVAQSANLRKTAQGLLDIGLVTLGDVVVRASQLRNLDGKADRVTLVAIARLLLAYAPPPWLGICVGSMGVRFEYIPSRDLQELSWLGDELESLLLDAHGFVSTEERDAFRKRFGTAAELVILASKEREGCQPIHVAALSDAYGYDIECRLPTTQRIEVKAASGNTRFRFHLTRNEFDKSKLHGKEWRLVQVVFSTRAFVVDYLTPAEIEEILVLREEALRLLVPSDTDNFKWTDSAEIVAPAEAWNQICIDLAPDFMLPGFQLR
jgi:hypothetical protein